jgi:hypothetical protein
MIIPKGGKRLRLVILLAFLLEKFEQNFRRDPQMLRQGTGSNIAWTPTLGILMICHIEGFG